jgi:hypothetical protein
LECTKKYLTASISSLTGQLLVKIVTRLAFYISVPVFYYFIIFNCFVNDCFIKHSPSESYCSRLRGLIWTSFLREYVLLIWETVDSWWLEMDVLSSDPQCSSMASILHINWKVAMEVIYPALGRSVNAL